MFGGSSANDANKARSAAAAGRRTGSYWTVLKLRPRFVRKREKSILVFQRLCHWLKFATFVAYV